MMNLLSTFIRSLFNTQQASAKDAEQTRAAENLPADTVVEAPVSEPVVTVHSAPEPSPLQADLRAAISGSRDAVKEVANKQQLATCFEQLGTNGFRHKAKELLSSLGFAVSPANYCDGLLATKHGLTALVCLSPNAGSLSNIMQRGFGLRDLDACQAIQDMEQADELIVICAGRLTRSVIPEASLHNNTVINGQVFMRMLLSNALVPHLNKASMHTAVTAT